MKIWLNDRKVKEAKFAMLCYNCVFYRNVVYYPFRSTCLLRTLNLRKGRDLCFGGYIYEDMA